MNDQQGTARAVETKEILLIVSEVKELNDGIERVTLKPQYNQQLNNQLLTSGSRTMEPWTFFVPQNTSIFKHGNSYRCILEPYTGRT